MTRRLEDALRAGKRQAAPFRKGPPKADPKTPGRKSGEAHGPHGHRPPPPRGAVRFPRQVIALFTEAIHERNRFLRGEGSLEALQTRRDEFDDRLLALTRPSRSLAEYERLAKHLWNHSEQWFAFVSDPTIEATTWKAEQAIRPAVVNRKVWGGNRTATGAHAQGVLSSAFETCRRQTRSALDYVSQTLRSVGNRLLPRPVLLATR